MGSHRQRQTLLLRAACGSIRDNRARAACGALCHLIYCIVLCAGLGHLIYCIVLCAGLWITRCFGEQWLWVPNNGLWGRTMACGRRTMVCGFARAQNNAINQNPVLKNRSFLPFPNLFFRRQDTYWEANNYTINIVFDPLAGFSGHGERDLATGLAGGFLRNEHHSGFSRSALNWPCLAGCLAGCLEGARR